MSEDLLLTLYERAWNAGDPDACAGCFAEDGVRESRVRYARVTAGREAIRDEIAMAMEALPDLEVAILAVGYASDRRLWTEWRVEGTRVADAGAPAAWRPSACRCSASATRGSARSASTGTRRSPAERGRDGRRPGGGVPTRPRSIPQGGHGPRSRRSRWTGLWRAGSRRGPARGPLYSIPLRFGSGLGGKGPQRRA